MSTDTVTAPAVEVEPLDVDALRKKTIRNLLDLAAAYNLPWFREVATNDYRPSGYLYLELRLDDDEYDTHTAWAIALGLTVDTCWVVGQDEPFMGRRSSTWGLFGWGQVMLITHLRPQRGLPEQGPRPTDAALIVAAVLAPDDAALPGDPIATAEQAHRELDADVAEILPETCDECESTGRNCSLHDTPEWREDEAQDAPRSWSAGDTIPADVTEVRDFDSPEDPGTWHRVAEGNWCFHAADGEVGTPQRERTVLQLFGPVAEVAPVPAVCPVCRYPVGAGYCDHTGEVSA
jgi:hypothetical protein